MNFEVKKKKVVWTIIISVLGSTLFWYLTSIGTIFETQEKVEGRLDVLNSLNPLGSGFGYLVILIIAMWIILFVVVYLLWSFFEKS